MADYYKNLVTKPKYEARTEFDDVKGRQYPTMTFMSNELVPGSNVYIEMGWVYAMPDPNPHIPKHSHDNSDEFILHIGSDYKNPEDLGGEIELVVGGQPFKINKTSAIYIPKGVVHGPLTWKSVTRPHLQMTIIMGAGTLAEAAPAGYGGKK
jgi:hypothetical protein